MFNRFEMHVPVVAIAVAPQSSAEATVNGVTLDQNTLLTSGGPFREAVFAMQIGAVSGNPDSFTATMEVQDSADGTNWTDVTNTAELVEAANVVANAANTVKTLGVRLKGCRRYVRASVAVDFTGGTSPSLLLAVSALLGSPARI